MKAGRGSIPLATMVAHPVALPVAATATATPSARSTSAATARTAAARTTRAIARTSPATTSAATTSAAWDTAASDPAAWDAAAWDTVRLAWTACAVVGAGWFTRSALGRQAHFTAIGEHVSEVQTFGLEFHAVGGCDLDAAMLDIPRALEEGEVQDALRSMCVSAFVQGRFGLDDLPIPVVEPRRRRRRRDRCDRSLSWAPDARMRLRLVALDLALYGKFSP